MNQYLLIVSLCLSAMNLRGQDNFLGNSRLINDSVKVHLEGIYSRTMNPRENFFKAINKFGANSTEAKRMEHEMIKNDSILLSEVLQIYATYEWPKLSQVDTVASAWAAIQIIHADLDTQRKFLPIFYKELINGEILGESWALLVDKLLMLSGETQIYGTQNTGFTYVNGERKTILWPVENYGVINDLRKSIGMTSVEESLLLNGSIYDPEITLQMVTAE